MKKIIRCAASVVLAMSFLAGLIPANISEVLDLPAVKVRADELDEDTNNDSGTEDPEETGYSVTIKGAGHTTSEGGSRTQTNLTGPMEPVILISESGYQFRTFSDKIENGITVTRIDSTHVRIEGTPTADTEVYILPAVETWVVATSASQLETALHDGSNVRLGNDIELDDKFYVWYSGTLDLNGFTLTIKDGSDYFVVEGPEFVICDDSAAGGGKIVGGIYVFTNAHLSILGGTIDDQYSPSDFIAASVTITGGRFRFDPTIWVPDGYLVVDRDTSASGYYEVVVAGDYSPMLALTADSSKVYLYVRIPYVNGQMPSVTYGYTPVTLTQADGYGYFTIECPMKNIADKVNLTVMNGDAVIYNSDISVSDYLRAVLRTHPGYADIIISILRYSSAAQMCLNWPDSDISEPDPRLANYGIADASVSGIRNLNIPSDPTRPSSDAIANAFNENLMHSEYYGMNMSYTYDTSLLIAFRITDGENAAALAELVRWCEAWKTDSTGNYTIEEDTTGNYIIVKVLNTPICRLGDTFFMVDPDPTDTYGQLVPIRAIDYFARVTASDSGKPLAVTDLVRSLYAYYLAASALN